jgi:GNAT superfamily N-acetyltransferase
MAARLMNSRTIPLVDERPAWSIGCLRIRPGHRRRGIATALLDGVVEGARTAGVPGVEASVAFTLDTYAHVMPGMQPEAAEQSSDLVWGGEDVEQASA